MVLNKKNSNCKTYEIKIDTDATNIEPIQWWLHDTSFNQIIKIAIAALVLLVYQKELWMTVLQ